MVPGAERGAEGAAPAWRILVVGEASQAAKVLDEVFGRVVRTEQGADLGGLGASILQSCAVVVVDDGGCARGVVPLLRRLRTHCPRARCICALASTQDLIEAFNEQLLWRSVVRDGDHDELMRHVKAGLLEWQQELNLGVRPGFLGC